MFEMAGEEPETRNTQEYIEELRDRMKKPEI
jgi:hypothetical protein